jgi:hypothetical protein
MRERSGQPRVWPVTPARGRFDCQLWIEERDGRETPQRPFDKFRLRLIPQTLASQGTRGDFAACGQGPLGRQSRRELSGP